MDCAGMRRWMLDGKDPAAAEACQHLEDCPACQALFAHGDELARVLDDVLPPAADTAQPTFAELEHRLAREQTRWTRLAELPSTARWVVGGAGLVLPMGVGAALHRDNLLAYPWPRLVAELAALTGLALASCWLWLRPLYKPQPSQAIRWGVLLLALALPWVLSVLPAALPSGLPAASAPTQLARAARCFGFGSLIALPALLALATLGRRHAGLNVILPAAAAALGGVVGLELHCPEASPIHLVMGHAPIAIALPLLLVLAEHWRRRTREPRAGA